MSKRGYSYEGLASVVVLSGKKTIEHILSTVSNADDSYSSIIPVFFFYENIGFKIVAFHNYSLYLPVESKQSFFDGND